MLTFNELTLAQLPILQKYLPKAATRSNDYTVGGLLMWAPWFDYQYALEADTLFIRGRAEDNPGLIAFAMPMGELPPEQSVPLIAQYCRAMGLEPVFSAIPDDRVAEFADSVPHACIEAMSDNWSDYVYDIDDLADLRGRRFNKKRNHVNRFCVDNPQYAFEALTCENAAEAATWLEGGEMPTSDLGRYERSACAAVLRNWGSYPFAGAVLRTAPGQPIVGLTVGEVLGDTLFVHIEKMDHDVPGAGAAVNSLFARLMRQQYPELKYVNREDDLGDPGLRRAKASYNPSFKLRKHNIVI